MVLIDALHEKSTLDFIDTSFVLTGKECPAIMGNALSEFLLRKAVQSFGGLLGYGHCLHKAAITGIVLGQAGFPCSIQLGQMFVHSSEGNGVYWFDYNPPDEFHAWLICGDQIIDTSLPGAISRGLSLHDDQGPFLVGREPVILNGNPPEWLEYHTKKVLTVSEANDILSGHSYF